MDAAALEHAIKRLEMLGAAESEILARRRFLDLLAPAPGDTVLDAGAGIGTIALDVARRVGSTGRVVALDPSAELLDRARTAAAAAGLGDVVVTEVGDARAIPHPNASFDSALCHWILLHVAPQATIVRELRRVTRPGGKVLLVECDWETAIVHPGDRTLTRKILQAGSDRHLDSWMGRKLVPLLRACGLKDVSILPIVDVETMRGPWLEFVRSRTPHAVEAGLATQEEAASWIAAIEEAAGGGGYFFSVTQFAAIGVV
jgi:ubiquinone/menaquinone biosynthesis C-methylase UbiE